MLVLPCHHSDCMPAQVNNSPMANLLLLVPYRNESSVWDEAFLSSHFWRVNSAYVADHNHEDSIKYLAPRKCFVTQHHLDNNVMESCRPGVASAYTTLLQ